MHSFQPSVIMGTNNGIHIFKKQAGPGAGGGLVPMRRTRVQIQPGTIFPMLSFIMVIVKLVFNFILINILKISQNVYLPPYSVRTRNKLATAYSIPFTL